MRPATTLILVAMILLVSCGGTQAKQPVQSQPAALLDIKCERDGDAITASTEAGKTILQITSKRGIGGATITRTSDHWPKELVLRVYLGGLEDMSITSGDVRLNASVLSHSGHPRLLHLWKKNEEGPQLDKDSPFWMNVAVFDAQGKPIDGLPKQGGWFEMTIPKALLLDQEKVLKLHWIDFFRR